MITIVGGGLAGLALGVYLRKLGVETQLFEKRTYPRHKVCGEFICGVSELTLQKMGVAEAIISRSVHHNRMAWWIKGKQILQDEMPSVAWGISRYSLDRELSELFVRGGGLLHLGQHFLEEGEGVVLSSGKRKASGSNTWIGLKVHASGGASQQVEGLEMHVGSSGYIGLCGIEEQRLNCCGLFKLRREVKGRGSDLLSNYLYVNGLQILARRLESMHLDECSFSAIAGFEFGKVPYENRFLLGDAGYLIPPFTGNGMSMALESAFLAGGILQKYDGGLLSWEECCILYSDQVAKLFQKRMKLALRLHPLLFHSIGQYALGSLAPLNLFPTQFLFHHLRSR